MIIESRPRGVLRLSVEHCFQGCQCLQFEKVLGSSFLAGVFDPTDGVQTLEYWSRRVFFDEIK